MEHRREEGHPDLATPEGAVQRDGHRTATSAAVMKLQRQAGNRAATIAVQRETGRRGRGRAAGAAVAGRRRGANNGPEWDLDNHSFIRLAQQCILSTYRGFLGQTPPNILTDQTHAQFHLMSPADFRRHIEPFARNDHVDPSVIYGHEHNGQVFVRANPGTHSYFITLVHETLHAVSRPAGGLPQPLVEGLTQKFAVTASRSVIDAHIGGSNYEQESQIAYAMSGMLGADVLRRAYFQGDPGLPAAVNSALGTDRAWGEVERLYTLGHAGLVILHDLFREQVRMQVEPDGRITYPDA